MSFNLENNPLLPDSIEVLKAKQRAHEIALERHPVWIAVEDLLLSLAEAGYNNSLIDPSNPETLAQRIRENLRLPVDRPELKDVGIKPSFTDSYSAIIRMALAEASMVGVPEVQPIHYWKAAASQAS